MSVGLLGTHSLAGTPATVVAFLPRVALPIRACSLEEGNGVSCPTEASDKEQTAALGVSQDRLWSRPLEHRSPGGFSEPCRLLTSSPEMLLSQKESQVQVLEWELAGTLKYSVL